MSDEYDASKNSAAGYELACSEIRRRGIEAGTFDPITDAERLLARRGLIRRRFYYFGRTALFFLAFVGAVTIAVVITPRWLT